jgi:hypothetical protein
MALGSTRPLTEMSTRCIFWGGKGGRCVRLTTLPPPCAAVMKSGNLNFLEPSGPLQACNGTALPFFTVKRRNLGLTISYNLRSSVTLLFHLSHLLYFCVFQGNIHVFLSLLLLNVNLFAPVHIFLMKETYSFCMLINTVLDIARCWEISVRSQLTTNSV